MLNKKIVSVTLVAGIVLVGGFVHGSTQDLKLEARKKLSQVKVASLYENLTDGGPIGRSMDDTIGILKETKTDLIFRGFWKWAPVVDSADNLPPALLELAPAGTTSEQAAEALGKSGHYQGGRLRSLTPAGRIC